MDEKNENELEFTVKRAGSSMRCYPERTDQG
jgi:hypothetical protein